MGKDLKHRRDERKKPTMSLKERRAKKQEKRAQRTEGGEQHLAEPL